MVCWKKWVLVAFATLVLASTVAAAFTTCVSKPPLSVYAVRDDSIRKPNTSINSFNPEEGGDERTNVEKKDSSVLGGASAIAILVVLYSEYTLKMTGCGLPAGPGGIVGGVEGLSYLTVVGTAAYSIYNRVTTGRGLPGTILGATEGLSFLAIVAGLVVLGFQMSDYGYIPNAVPMEGGMCQ